MFTSMATLHSLKPKPPKVLIYTPFTFTIEVTSSTPNVTGTASNYPITFNPNGTSNTYGNITNFSKTTIQNKNITIYVKGRIPIVNTAVNKCLYSFGKDYSTVNDWVQIGISSTAPSCINYIYKEGASTVYDGVTSSILANATYFHTFVVFNVSTSKVQLFVYSNTSVLLFTLAPTTYTPAIIFQNFVNYNLARDKFGTCYNTTIGLAGYYNAALSSTQMLNVVNQSPN